MVVRHSSRVSRVGTKCPQVVTNYSLVGKPIQRISTKRMWIKYLKIFWHHWGNTRILQNKSLSSLTIFQVSAVCRYSAVTRELRTFVGWKSWKMTESSGAPLGASSTPGVVAFQFLRVQCIRGPPCLFCWGPSPHGPRLVIFSLSLIYLQMSLLRLECGANGHVWLFWLGLEWRWCFLYCCY